MPGLSASIVLGTAIANLKPDETRRTLIGFFNAFFQAMAAPTSGIVRMHPRWTTRRTFSNIGAETCNEPRGELTGGGQWGQARIGNDDGSRRHATGLRPPRPHAGGRAPVRGRRGRAAARSAETTHGRYPAPGKEHAMR